MNTTPPFPPERWEQTPIAVQEYIRTLEARVAALEATVQQLLERLQQDSRNSSRPPRFRRPLPSGGLLPSPSCGASPAPGGRAVPLYALRWGIPAGLPRRAECAGRAVGAAWPPAGGAGGRAREVPGKNAVCFSYSQPLRVALIQPNIGMYEKRSGADREAQLDLQFGLSAATLDQQPDGIIWPESMYPFGVPAHFQQLPWPALPTAPQVHWLIGALTYAGQGTARQVFNSAFLLDSERRIQGRYDKQDLLAFGEYIPFQRYVPLLGHISPAIGNLTPGVGGILRLPNGVGLGPLICYEDIIPGLARRAVQQGAQVLVNLTNDVWFGDTRAPYQHRALAAFRAVENRVTLVRVTNTDLTSVIDALGQEHATLPLFQAEARVHTIQPLRLFSLYTTIGDSFAWLCSAVAGLLPLWQWFRRRRHKA